MDSGEEAQAVVEKFDSYVSLWEFWFSESFMFGASKFDGKFKEKKIKMNNERIEN